MHRRPNAVWVSPQAVNVGQPSCWTPGIGLSVIRTREDRAARLTCVEPAVGGAFGRALADAGTVVGRMSGFIEGETFRTWTAVAAAVGIFGLVQVLVLAALFPLV